MHDKVKWVILYISNMVVGYSLGNYIIYATLTKIYKVFRDSMTPQQIEFMFDLINKRYIYAIFFAFIMWMFTTCLWFVSQNIGKSKCDSESS